ncbi:DevR family CRISPR-associated autoregulator [Thermoanaerobacterium thermosaccharolyticum]|nr:DevR family CRISPR-associated autoregulator [Thermoanaerobacterium thermosaccharolyticum]
MNWQKMKIMNLMRLMVKKEGEWEMDKNFISSLSICGELGLNMHSLNNEGGEGNQVLTREVTIVNEDGKIFTVNAVSGDMLKHIQAEHLYHISIEKGLPLCEKCKVFDANRISGDKTFTEETKDKKDEEILDMLVNKCVIDDLEGILITNNNKNLPRKSAAEFGWLIGIPEKVKTDTFFHVKLVANAGNKSNDESANQGQNIFHRPANSGIYALVSNYDIYRIGYNEISRTYAIDAIQRCERYKAFLQSIMYTFIKPNGAMRNTQDPHIISFKGVIAISNSTVPAPTISPLNDTYTNEIKAIAENINKLEKSSIRVIEFNTLSEFTEIMTDLIQNYEPYELGANN